MGESIEEVSSLGMEKWFLDNIPYAIESYLDFSLNSLNFDSPTENFGFNATYDPKYKRIILSKRAGTHRIFTLNTYRIYSHCRQHHK